MTNKLKNLVLAFTGSVALVCTSCNNNSNNPQLTQEQINYQLTDLTHRAHPLPGLYESEAFQRHVNPHLYQGVKK